MCAGQWCWCQLLARDARRKGKGVEGGGASREPRCTSTKSTWTAGKQQGGHDAELEWGSEGAQLTQQIDPRCFQLLHLSTAVQIECEEASHDVRDEAQDAPRELVLTNLGAHATGHKAWGITQTDSAGKPVCSQSSIGERAHSRRGNDRPNLDLIYQSRVAIQTGL